MGPDRTAERRSTLDPYLQVMILIQIDQNSDLTMKTLSLSEARMRLSALVEEVRRTDQEIVITKNGVPAAVLVSPDEFDGWRETLAIRLDEQGVSEIREGLDALEDGRSALYTLDELFEVESRER